MDGMPVRGGSSVPNRPTPQRPEERSSYEEPRTHSAPVHHHAQRPKEEKSNKKLIIIGAIIGAVLLVLLIVGGIIYALSNKGMDIDGSKYQAVFFTNGQVYFGKLQEQNSKYLKLTDIYYLQTQNDSTKSLQQTSGDQSSQNVQLIKLGNEIHGPDDEMIISRDQVLFYENLKPDSKVVQSIQKSKSSN